MNAVERVALAINQETKKQWDGQPIGDGLYDPNTWTATGGVLNLSDIAQAAIKELAKIADDRATQYMIDEKPFAAGSNYDVRDWLNGLIEV